MESNLERNPSNTNKFVFEENDKIILPGTQNWVPGGFGCDVKLKLISLFITCV